MMSSNYAFIRVMKIKDHAHARALGEHGRRARGDLQHVDPDRTSLNRFGLRPELQNIGIDFRYPERAIRAFAAKHSLQRRRNAPVGMNIIVSASADYFGCRSIEADTVGGIWDRRKLEHWLKQSVRFLDTRFPGMLVSWRLDMDETTPHLDTFLVPYYEKKTATKSYKVISVGKVLGEKRADYSKLQDDYAVAMAPLGLQRGVPVLQTRAEHRDFRRYDAEKLNDVSKKLAELGRDLGQQQRELDEKELILLHWEKHLQANQQANLQAQKQMKLLHETAEILCGLLQTCADLKCESDDWAECIDTLLEAVEGKAENTLWETRVEEIREKESATPSSY